MLLPIAPSAEGPFLQRALLDNAANISPQAAMKLPNSEKAFVDIAKLRDYSLNPEHESGGHKARVFRAALGLTLDDAEWLRIELLRIAREGNATPGELVLFGQKYVIDAKLTSATEWLLCEQPGSSKMGRTSRGW